MRITALAIVFSATLFACALPTQARVVQIQYGDIDGGTYNGPASADHVYVDPAWMAAVNSNWPDPSSHFDASDVDYNVAFTFLFPLQPDESVTAASLTLGLRATFPRDVTTDALFLDDLASTGDGRYDYPNLDDWLPIPSSPTATRTLDLATSLGRNALPTLQDGQLNVLVRDDSLVDYAILNLTIVPEPTSATLLALSTLPLLRRRRRH